MRLGPDGGIRDPLAGPGAAFVDPTSGLVMGATGDNVAKRYWITREQADEFALRSHERALAANRDGSFAPDIVAVGEMEHDEHPRETTLSALAKRFPAVDLLPHDDIEAEAHVVSWMSFIASTLHPARRQGLDHVRQVYRIADKKLGHAWAIGERYSRHSTR